MAFLNKGVKISIKDDRYGHDDVFYYEGGIKQFVEYINRTKTPIHKDIVYFEVTEASREVEIAIHAVKELAKCD
jgi:DNA gyrase subunit B